ncbi:MAG TPA: hypothetical protein VJN96_13330 [Vicinamibacterales bacterium]|nr:hypothetical protein [Vicinamibacterales bacterium]
MRGLVLAGTAIVAAAASGSLRAGAQNSGAIPPALYADLTWRCTGPFDGGPVASVEGVAGQPGVYTIVTPGGSAWKTTDGGGTWASIERPIVTSAAGDPHRWVDPANPRRIAQTQAQGIAVSLDGGGTWVASRHLPIAEVARLSPRARAAEPPESRRQIAGAPVTVSIADPVRTGLVFAGTRTGVFVSFDNGARWASLQLNLPAVAINDLDIRGNNLIAATQGRSTWTLEDISPLRQIDGATASAAARLFAPADVVARSSGGVSVDYYLGASPARAVTLEVLDATGRVVHAASSVAADPNDHWLPLVRPLPISPGHHRVVWDLRVDPPSSPHHRFARLAPALFHDEPADPAGPMVTAGNYRVRLTAGGRTYTQPLVVRSDPAVSPAALQQQFDLAMKAYDAMQIAHRGFLQLARTRTQIRPLLTSSDSDVAAEAATLDTRLAALDGSDWTGLVIPDADDEAQEVDEKEGKHPDFVPPKAVSLSKDYDDPTSVLGRNFANVDHAPAFAIVGTKLGEMLTRIGRGSDAPDALALQNYATSCEQLAGVLDAWRTINAQDLPKMNVELSKRRLPALAVAANVPAIACAAK